MIDFSSFNNNLEGFNITNVLIIAILSFVLSTLIGITYEKTSRDIERPRFFIQALILISVPVATVMQAIGDSLAYGLGLLGALAIIRFRTTLKNPRNIVFMFSSIAVGVSTGVYGISISVIGTISFCLIVFLLHISHLGKPNHIVGNLQFELPNKDILAINLNNEIIDTINSYCIKAVLLRYVIKNIKRPKKKKVKGMAVFDYQINLKDKESGTDLANEITKKFSLLNVKLTFKDNENEKI